MIQDIYPHKIDNQYRNISPADHDLIIIEKNGSFLMKDTGNDFCFPEYQEFILNNECTYLFSIDDESYFFYDEIMESGNDYEYVDLRKIRQKNPTDKKASFAAYTAHHLIDWYRNNRYCGRCGKLLEKDEKERALRCKCGNIIYPRINPAVIVGVINKDRLLLTKYAKGYGGNALVAGFVEIGESLEETVKREVKEETGLQVENIRYYKSQPWGIADDILAGFYCDVKGDDTIIMETYELKYAAFVERKDIELQESDFSLTNEMMKRFKEGKEC